MKLISENCDFSIDETLFIFVGLSFLQSLDKYNKNKYNKISVILLFGWSQLLYNTGHLIFVLIEYSENR